jgi:hypothetical protein
MIVGLGVRLVGVGGQALVMPLIPSLWENFPTCPQAGEVGEPIGDQTYTRSCQ